MTSPALAFASESAAFDARQSGCHSPSAAAPVDWQAIASSIPAAFHELMREECPTPTLLVRAAYNDMDGTHVDYWQSEGADTDLQAIRMMEDMGQDASAVEALLWRRLRRNGWRLAKLRGLTLSDHNAALVAETTEMWVDALGLLRARPDCKAMPWDGE